MHRRLLIAVLTVGFALFLSTAALAATTGQGPVNGQKCGISVGFAIKGGVPVEVVTTNENQQVSGRIPFLGTFTETTCADLLPSTAQTKTLLAIQTGPCMQYNPLGAKNTGIAGSNTVIVIGTFFGKGGIFSGTCRTLIPLQASA